MPSSPRRTPPDRRVSRRSRPARAGSLGGRLGRALASLLLGVLAAVATPAGALAATYYVDVAAGVDDTARDGLSPATSWKTLTFAVQRIFTPGPHEIQVAAGEYSQATGEFFPVTLPAGASLVGAGTTATVFRDSGNGGAGTIRWFARSVVVPPASPQFRDFSVVREPVGGQPIGAALELRVDSTSASPMLTNLVLRGASRGLDLYALADLTATTLSPVASSCAFVENALGVLGTAYTATGQSSSVAPTFTNCVSMRNAGDGMVFETAANWDLPNGPRGNSSSTPIITHSTIADNLGSALLLDNSNGYIRYRSGPVNPRITNSILSDNGDYALHEYTSTTDPAQFDNNLIGGNNVALYRDEGTTDILTLASMPTGTGNVDASAKFVRGLAPDWHLRGDSPGIDALATSAVVTDFEGETRPVDGNGDGTALYDMGADEAAACAVDAVIDPAAPVDRCGLEAPMTFTAAASAMAAGFNCTQPLEFTWYADGVEAGTGPDLTVVPDATTTYTVLVRCPDQPATCVDSVSARQVVHVLPIVDAEAGVTGTPTGDYEACIAWDAPDVTVALLGTAEPGEGGTTIRLTDWIASDGILLGAGILNPLLAVTNNGQNQDIAVSLTATDTNGCSSVSFTRVHVWRGPQALAGGPYESCQNLASTQTFVPLTGNADVPPGSAPASWLWRTDVGQFEDSGLATSTLQNPRLKLTNFRFNRTANLSLTVTDDKGCSHETTTTATLYWTPAPHANGPYQEPEAPASPTSIVLAGTYDGPPGSALSWTTDIGTFQSTGTQVATGADQILDIPNTGGDQLGQVCLTATPAGGTCPGTECTAVSVRTSPPQPPHDIGGTLLIVKAGTAARLSWANPPIDATHDRADVFDAWESVAAGAGAWSPRTTLQDVPRTAGGVTVDDPSLLDTAGPDLLFLKIVSENGGGLSCADPATELPDCPSIEDCGNGVDDDGDRRADCADPSCVGVPPC